MVLLGLGYWYQATLKSGCFVAAQGLKRKCKIKSKPKYEFADYQLGQQWWCTSWYIRWAQQVSLTLKLEKKFFVKLYLTFVLLSSYQYCTTLVNWANSQVCHTGSRSIELKNHKNCKNWPTFLFRKGCLKSVDYIVVFFQWFLPPFCF